MTTPAGDYRTRITVRACTRTPNSMNEPVPSYDTTHCTVWAKVEPTSGREFIAAQAVHAELAAMIRVRYSERTKAITPDMRVQFDSRVLNIAAVYDPGSLHREIVLICTEAV